jgi:hypothetical protein
VHPVLQAAELHYNLVAIHPFADGNGRTARLLMNYNLLRHGYPHTIVEVDFAAHRRQCIRTGILRGRQPAARIQRGQERHQRDRGQPWLPTPGVVFYLGFAKTSVGRSSAKPARTASASARDLAHSAQSDTDRSEGASRSLSAPGAICHETERSQIRSTPSVLAQTAWRPSGKNAPRVGETPS